MPSASFRKFESNLLVDVDRIIGSHAKLNHNGRGRRALGHLTRSGVLMLCAAWELYVEEVLIEGVDFFLSQLHGPRLLPKSVQKELARSVRESKHELKPLELAGDGWKNLYRNHARAVLQGLNTPNSSKLDPVFRRLLGIDSVSDWWSLGTSVLDGFVTARGDIAHRGREASYVTIVSLKTYKTQIVSTALDVDNELTEYLCKVTPGAVRPWRRRH